MKHISEKYNDGSLFYSTFERAFNYNEQTKALSEPSDLCNLKTYQVRTDSEIFIYARSTHSLPRHANVIVIVITCIAWTYYQKTGSSIGDCHGRMTL